MKVRCRANDGAHPGLTLGRMYDAETAKTAPSCYMIIDDNGRSMMYNKSRFDLLSAETKKIRVRCKNNDNIVSLTVGKTYEVEEKPSPTTYMVVNDFRIPTTYEKIRFVVLKPKEGTSAAPSEKANWDAIADTLEGFLGWAEPMPEDHNEERYAIIRKEDTGFCVWLCVPPFSKDLRAQSTVSWGGENAIYNAQQSALQRKKDKAWNARHNR